MCICKKYFQKVFHFSFYFNIGMNDWVLESEHYEYYRKVGDFKIPVEKEKILSFPKHLQLYTYEEFSEEKFSAPQKGSTGVLGLI